jgi:hypothetical protein
MMQYIEGGITVFSNDSHLFRLSGKKKLADGKANLERYRKNPKF